MDDDSLNQISELPLTHYIPSSSSGDISRTRRAVKSPSFNLQLESYDQTEPPRIQKPLKLDWFNKQLQGVDFGTNLNGWDIDTTLSYLQNGKFGTHTCAKSVEDALAKGGLTRMYCSENGGNGWASALHYNGILANHGWKLVAQGDSNNTNIDARKGDICVQGNSASDTKNSHVAIFDGKQWLSNYKQDKMMAHSDRNVKYFIYRRQGVQNARNGGILRAELGLPLTHYESTDNTLSENVKLEDTNDVIDKLSLLKDFNLQLESYDNLDPLKITSDEDAVDGKLNWFSPQLPTVKQTHYSGKGYENFIKLLDKVFPNASQDFKDFAIYTANNESGFNPNATNNSSSASGYFGIINSTWNQYGSGNKSNPEDQIKCMYNLYKAYNDTYENSPTLKTWRTANGYSKAAVLHAMHYAGIGNIKSLASNGALSSNKGVNNVLLNRILKGLKYNG